MEKDLHLLDRRLKITEEIYFIESETVVSSGEAIKSSAGNRHVLRLYFNDNKVCQLTFFSPSVCSETHLIELRNGSTREICKMFVKPMATLLNKIPEYVAVPS